MPDLIPAATGKPARLPPGDCAIEPGTLAGVSGSPFPPEDETMNKFASLQADVSKPFRVFLIDPVTEDFITTEGGEKAYIDVWAADSERGRAFDKSKRKELMLRIKQSRTGKVDPDDALEENIAKCVALTDGWFLVDPATRQIIDVVCNEANAADLYSPPGMGWLFIQPWMEANKPANFLPKRSPPSTGGQNGVSAATESLGTPAL
jgi:predicted transcriptional regulator